MGLRSTVGRRVPLARRRERHAVPDGGEPDASGRGSSRTRFGWPEPCPRCGGHGYLDRIDLPARAQTQHCPGCSHVWTTEF